MAPGCWRSTRKVWENNLPGMLSAVNQTWTKSLSHQRRAVSASHHGARRLAAPKQPGSAASQHRAESPCGARVAKGLASYHWYIQPPAPTVPDTGLWQKHAACTQQHPCRGATSNQVCRLRLPGAAGRKRLCGSVAQCTVTGQPWLHTVFLPFVPPPSNRAVAAPRASSTSSSPSMK